MENDASNAIISSETGVIDANKYALFSDCSPAVAGWQFNDSDWWPK